MAEKRNDNLTEGPIVKTLLRFFFPILFGMLFQQLYNTVDAIVVGKMEGTAALAAVGGSAARLINLTIGFVAGLSSGATVIVSQLYGAGNKGRITDTVFSTIAFYTLVGVGLTVLFYFIAPAALALLKDPEDIRDLSATYLRIFFVGAVPFLLYNIGSGILRAVGDSRRPLYYLLICCGINIILDIVFVAVFRMGVAGVAWATVIAETVSAVLVMRCLLKTKEAYRLKIDRNSRISWYTLMSTFRIGLPAAVQNSMFDISNAIIQIAVNGLGTLVVASWTAIGKIDGVFWMTTSAFGTALCAFVGQCYGAGMIDRMKKGSRISFFMELGAAAFLGAVILCFTRPLMHIITDDETVIDYAVVMLRCFAPFYVVWTVIDTIGCILRGVGRALPPAIISVLGICGFRILWINFVVPHWDGIVGISMCYGISWVLTAAIMAVYYFKAHWLKQDGSCSSAATR